MSVRQDIIRHLIDLSGVYPDTERLGNLLRDEVTGAYDPIEKGLVLLKPRSWKRLINNPTDLSERPFPRVIIWPRYQTIEYLELIHLSYLTQPSVARFRMLMRDAVLRARSQYGPRRLIGVLNDQCWLLRLGNNRQRRLAIMEAVERLGFSGVREESGTDDVIVTVDGREVNLGRIYARTYPICLPGQDEG